VLRLQLRRALSLVGVGAQLLRRERRALWPSLGGAQLQPLLQPQQQCQQQWQQQHEQQHEQQQQQ
jgi:hypothetical protein